MKPKILLSVLFVFLAQILFAQKNEQDVVYLKNGSIVRGFISEFIPEKSITIKTGDQNIFVFEMSEVEKITREEPPVQKRTYKIKDNGYFNETAMLFMVGGEKDAFTTAQSLTTVNGYQVNRYFRVGGGLGVTHYVDYSHTFLPVFARVSGDMIKFRITPIYFADAGYGFFIEKDGYNDSNIQELSSKGGLMVHAGVGVKFYTSHNASFTLSTGFNLQKSSREYQYTWSEGYTYREDRIYRRYTFGVGVNF